MKKKPTWISLLLVLFFGGLFAAYQYAMRFHPLELAEWSARWELSQAGVRSITVGGLHAWEADHCAPPDVKAGAQAPCRCVALIHGLGDTGLTWKRMLLSPGERWGGEVKVLALDLPGSGGSPALADPADYRARSLAARVRDVLASRCETWTMVGNSFGGWVAAWVAMDRPEGVERLVLLGAAGVKEADPGSGQRAVPETFLDPGVEALRDFQRRAYHRPRELPDHVWQAAVRRMERSNSREVLGAQLDEDLVDERFAKVTAPVMLVWGESDRISPPARAERFKAYRGDGPVRVRIVPRCGHLPQKECPDAVFEALGPNTKS